ncbi:(d)CMP kinase [bacterium]|nr:(d)CMP kinase [bacterium]
MNKVVITIDGGAGTGTSSLSKRISALLGIEWLSSGDLYRALTWGCLENGVSFDPGQLSADEGLPPELTRACAELARDFAPHIKDGTVVSVCGRQVDEQMLRNMSPYVPHIAKLPLVRAEIVKLQHQFAKYRPAAIIEGRNVGVDVFPEALRKIFLKCNPTEALRRRAEHDHAIAIEDVAGRDQLDRTRAVAQLRPAPDAIVYDTTDTLTEQLAKNVILSLKDVPVAREFIASYLVRLTA